MAKTTSYRPLVFFYIMVAYVFASYFWWGYLLLEDNRQIFNTQVQIARQQYVETHPGRPARAYEQTPGYREHRNRFNRQRWMIIGEGIVFLLILVLGILKIRQAIIQEMALAEQQKNFLLSITHELKSPLASMKLALQTLAARVLPEDKRKRLVGISLNDIDRLESLVDNILLAAKIDNPEFSFGDEAFDLSALVEKTVQKLREHHKAAATIHANLASGLRIRGDQTAIESVVINLMENAVKYSDREATIGIALSATAHRALLQVRDNGIGIPEGERKRIFKKFYRIGSEETRQTKGTGLGLYIVRQIVERHQGAIKVKAHQPCGTVFEVYFPLLEKGS